ncbi:MAG: hypothetical protein HYT70_02000 [Candidatus Aenigmarchaeota archaeon]|nr:hypothetical protein [Candidatus Aenigmarchaeota archaeon]
MVFGRKQQQEKDWKECMTEEDKEVLNSVLHMARKHKCAYMCADDSRVAQLWCAMLEFKKELDEVKAGQEKTQMPFKALSEMGDVEKRKTIDQLVRDMLKPQADQETAIQNLVNSLMKF